MPFTDTDNIKSLDGNNKSCYRCSIHGKQSPVEKEGELCQGCILDVYGTPNFKSVMRV